MLTVTGLRHRCLRAPIAAGVASQGSRQPRIGLKAAHSRQRTTQPASVGRRRQPCSRQVLARAQGGRDWQTIALPANLRRHAQHSDLRAAPQAQDSHDLPAPDTAEERSLSAQLWQLTRQAGVSLAAAALAVTLNAAPAPAADTAKVGTCLLASCQKELVLCLADANCAKNLVCLQTCNGRPDETDCQVLGHDCRRISSKFKLHARCMYVGGR